MMKQILLSSLLFALMGCEKPAEEKSDELQKEATTVVEKITVPIEVMIATEKEVPKKVKGSVVTRGIRELYLTAKTGGTITVVPVKLGDRVKKGKTIVAIESQVQKATLAQAQVGVDQAELNFSAVKRLYEKKSVSEAEYITAKNGISAAKANYTMSRYNYNNCWVRAPFSGSIAQLDQVAEKGNLIGAGTPVARLIDISKIKLNVYLGESEITHVSKGNRATITVSALDEELEGTVTAVAEGTDPATGSFQVEILVDNPGERVKSGMTGVVTIETSEVDQGILIARTGVGTRANEKFVLKVENGICSSVPVEAISLRGNRMLITGDITEGDTLALTGLTKLSTGDSVVVSVVESAIE